MIGHKYCNYLIINNFRVRRYVRFRQANHVGPPLKPGQRYNGGPSYIVRAEARTT